jgi:hypothetical protein
MTFAALRAAGIAVGLALATTSGWAADFHLVVEGSPALKLKVECLLLGKSTERKVHLEGFVPKSWAFRGEALACTVKKRDSLGNMQVELYQDGEVVAWGFTNAPYNFIRVRTAGPWGGAAARKGGGQVFPAPH